MTQNNYHIPVLLNDVIEGLAIHENGTYIDVTFGGGGHSKEILKRISTGKLVGFDQDQDAHLNEIDDSKFHLVKSNFRYLKQNLLFLGIREIDGLLADLGVSSHQFDDEKRGFTIRANEVLDMRMNQSHSVSAQNVLNEYPEEKLTEILKFYGEFKEAKKLARLIKSSEVQEWKTNDLEELVQKCCKPQKLKSEMAKVFQAIRIEVNEELEALKELIAQATELLKPGGRLVFISYHSLEDRLVKNYFKRGSFDGSIEKDFFGNIQKPLTELQSKPFTPTEEETENNPRARSAKMRIAIKN
jgi:16S rRNA (cytosine1402-N4)-methyltransferase